MSAKTFLIMAGGTGGHVFPAMATAEWLIDARENVAWMGSRNGMEEKLVNDKGIPFYGLSVSGVRGKGLPSQMLAPFRILLAVVQAIRLIRKINPDCVLGMGGFASGPGGVAARLMGKPLVIHEQNAVAGLTNKLLARIASSVLSAFPNAFPAEVESKRVGNPLRKEICDIYYRPARSELAGRKIRLLVLGGSLGAASLNECVPKALAKLDAGLCPDVWHQTGRDKDLATAAQYSEMNIEAKVTAFIDDMSEAYRWADFVICRAGALTISELCAAGLGAILVPYPHAVDDHQTLNASMMERAGAAWLLPQKDMQPETLAEILNPLLAKPERITLLADAAHKLGEPEATEHVAAECRRVCYA